MTLLALVLLGTSGCLEFDRQTMVIVFPEDSKEVRCLFVYEGLRVEGNKADNLETAKEQLTTWANTQDEFCLAPIWFARVNIKAEFTDNPEVQAQKEMLRKHLVIRNGAFFLNADGKLCYSQTVTIRDRNKFLPDLNDLVSEQMAHYANSGLSAPKNARSDDWCDEETLRLIQKASDGGKFPWIQMEPGRISVMTPSTPASANRLKEKLFAETLPKWFSDLPLSFDQRKDNFTLSLGYGDGEPIQLVAGELKHPNRDFEEKLIKHARTLKVPFKKDMTTEGLVEEFLKAQRKEKRR
jgi:hypothetical protein